MMTPQEAVDNIYNFAICDIIGYFLELELEYLDDPEDEFIDSFLAILEVVDIGYYNIINEYLGE